jgi:hypothetical protein
MTQTKNPTKRKINGRKDPDAVIKTNIEFDEHRDKFVIVCENLETLDYLLNMITYAREKLSKMVRNKLTHEECCALVEGSIEKGLQRLEYIKKRLHKGEDFVKTEVVASNCYFANNVLCNINYYGAYLHGMKQLLLKLRDAGLLEESRPKNGIPHAKGDELLYNKAIIDLLFADTRNIEMFLTDEHSIRFTDHERNKKGKLVKCRAYFAKRVTMYREVK